GSTPSLSAVSFGRLAEWECNALLKYRQDYSCVGSIPTPSASPLKAQLAEHPTVIRRVPGSSPGDRTLLNTSESMESRTTMSTFAVSIERIASVWAHNNADRLEMARLTSMSYQFVIAKGSFKAGDRVVYFPIDSLLPEPLITVLGLTGKLAGQAANRV